MSRRVPLLLALALAAGCGDGPAISDHDLTLRVVVNVDEVELGKGFPLTVVRSWSKDLLPEEWDDEALAPLVVRLEETERRESASHVEETRRMRAYAFDPGAVTVSAPSFVATPRGGGEERVAHGDRISLRVKRALDPKEPGPVEWPGGPRREPVPWLAWLVGGLTTIALMGLVAGRRRGPPQAAPTPPTVAARPHERALERVRRLREADPRDAAAVQAFHAEAAALVRDYVSGRFAAGTPQMTTEEFVAPGAVRALESRHLDLLSEFLVSCDLVKFARHTSMETARGDLLDNAVRFVDGTRQ